MADKAHTVHDNLLKRQFAPATPNQVGYRMWHIFTPKP
ncbi:hypothetical protein AO368_0461 [Moraxella catarrhalis]|uniref:Uncharacterized protein n=2 Tax=Moraxella catarrhalis TaxID=480 RepID=A0AB36DMU5_MORCA|nr:hypothetical protein AO376_1734 [Moraxella catarrhalis]OAV17134.1 hypothetical protein AO374_1261 [Moraxella catarrhalis]OAV23489.1 hypothetical protein AO370_1676 [Moraxella catarrhalis]OAV32389.1 hypothetical protein AO368_0461 [Moraxella catarrhalis]